MIMNEWEMGTCPDSNDPMEHLYEIDALVDITTDETTETVPCVCGKAELYFTEDSFAARMKHDKSGE
jgi:hypothetical protein